MRDIRPLEMTNSAPALPPSAFHLVRRPTRTLAAADQVANEAHLPTRFGARESSENGRPPVEAPGEHHETDHDRDQDRGEGVALQGVPEQGVDGLKIQGLREQGPARVSETEKGSEIGVKIPPDEEERVQSNSQANEAQC
jgi:hypothetical protein